MSDKRRVNKLNEILGANLGRNQFGEPLYKWCFSEDLLHPMALIEEREGEGWFPVLEYVADPKSGLIKAQQKFQLRKECPTLNNQWVLCKWLPPVDPDEWRRQFGHSMEWKSRGDYAPISANGSGNYAALDPHELPTEATTWSAIEVINRNRSVNHRQRDYEDQRRMDKHEATMKANMLDDMKEAGTIANRPYFPSKGDKDYSFGGVN